MARATVEDPIKVFNFNVQESGFKRAGCQEVSGLEATVEVAEYREGGDNSTVRKSAGLVSYGNVTLMRGQILNSAEGGDDDFLNWFKTVHDVTGGGNAANYRRDLDIVQLDAQKEECRRWRLYEAWPTRYKPMSDLNGKTSDNSIEELELAHEGFSPQ